MVTWRNSFILLGGNAYLGGVQTFDHVEQKWSELVSETLSNLWYAGMYVTPVPFLQYSHFTEFSNQLVLGVFQILNI